MYSWWCIYNWDNVNDYEDGTHTKLCENFKKSPFIDMPDLYLSVIIIVYYYSSCPHFTMHILNRTNITSNITYFGALMHHHFAMNAIQLMDRQKKCTLVGEIIFGGINLPLLIQSHNAQKNWQYGWRVAGIENIVLMLTIMLCHEMIRKKKNYFTTLVILVENIIFYHSFQFYLCALTNQQKNSHPGYVLVWAINDLITPTVRRNQYVLKRRKIIWHSGHG